MQGFLHETLDRYIAYADDDVEDKEMLIEMVRQIDSQIQVVVFNHGGELFEFLEALDPGSNLPCLILLDMKMPMVNGLETLKNLKEHPLFKQLPVIMFSTSDDNAEVKAAIEFGADDYKKKPVSTQQLREVTQKFVIQCAPRL